MKGNSVSVGPSVINGNGLFALRSFESGETICRSSGYVVDVRSRLLESWESRISYQLSQHNHFVPIMVPEIRENPLANLNHSCRPSSYVRYCSQSETLELIASREISAGDEITCDYAMTEERVAHPFHCKCGTNSCRGLIQGQA